MSDVLRLSCTIENEIARNATEYFADILGKAFEQYQKLLDEYLKLLKQCEDANIKTTAFFIDSEKRNSNNVVPSLQTSAQLAKPCNDPPREVLSDISSKCSTSMSESVSPSTPDIDFNVIDMALITSPVLVHRRNSKSRRNNITPVHMKFESTEPNNTSVKENINTLSNSFVDDVKVQVNTELGNQTLQDKCENIIECTPVSKAHKKAGVSKLYHTDTKLVESGKKMRQSKLLFVPTKENKDSTLCENEDLKPLDISSTPNKSSIGSSTIPCENNSMEEEIIESSPKLPEEQLKKISLRLKKKNPKKSSKFHKKENKRANELKDTKSCDIKLPLKHESNLNESLPPLNMSTQKDESFFTVSGSHGTTKSQLNLSKCAVSPLLFDLDQSGFLENVKNVSDDAAETKEPDVTNQSSKGQKRKLSQCSNTSSGEDETFFTFRENAEEKNPYDLKDSDFAEPMCQDEAEAGPAVKDSLMTSFDILPEKKEFEFAKPSKSKVERSKMNGIACWECDQYYKNLECGEDEMRKRQNQCSRHRTKFDERQCTPDGFWDPVFSQTMSTSYKHN